MKKLSKVLFAGLVIFSFFMMFGSPLALAAENQQDVEVNGDKVQKRINANETVQFRFRQRTQIRMRTQTNISVDIDCAANDIGDKDFEIEIESEKDLEMNMTCREEQAELGLQKGNAYQTRNRNRYQYQEGFAANISVNDTCQAKLKIQKTAENQNSEWAYYDESEDDWVTVETTEEDGYLVAETDHFSTWTLLTPEDNTLLYIGIGIGVAAAVI
ncbi:MAG: hypothetical protein ACOC35_06295, partial [Promethearchaeia archaeon]